MTPAEVANVANAANVAIVGAGPVGCTLALELKRCGIPAVLCAKRRPADGTSQPLRPIALSHASRLILERIGAWDAIQPTPIRSIHVSQAGAFGRTRIAAEDAGVPALGYVLDYGTLAAALFELAMARGVAIAAGAPPAALLVHAEGDAPEEGGKDYHQEALVTLVRADQAPSGIAYERFTREGPLALLPLEGRYAVVWAMAPDRAAELSSADERTFLAALGAAFGDRAGAFVAAEGRYRFPLALRVRASRTGVREAYVGNAAQTLHPVAGQGLNLGLRDAWDLARLLRDAKDPGDAQLLARYAALRRLDAMATTRITDLLAGAFTGGGPLLASARGAAMTALDAFSPARRFFARRMIFGTSAIP
ncbi:MAG: FAD-dependent monooxygenase [Betaproteobacteria bacterium]